MMNYPIVIKMLYGDNRCPFLNIISLVKLASKRTCLNSLVRNAKLRQTSFREAGTESAVNGLFEFRWNHFFISCLMS